VGTLKIASFPVSNDIAHLIIDTFLHFLVINARYFHTIISINLNFARMDFLSLGEDNISSVTGELFIPSITVFVGGAENISGVRRGYSHNCFTCVDNSIYIIVADFFASGRDF
jgi:hypothetical protein